MPYGSRPVGAGVEIADAMFEAGVKPLRAYRSVESPASDQNAYSAAKLHHGE